MSAEPMRCLKCGYVLEYLPEHRCPECGRPFDPSDPTTFRSKRSSRWRAAPLLAGTCLLLLMVLVQATRPHRNYLIVDLFGIELHAGHVFWSLWLAAAIAARMAFKRSPMEGTILFGLLLVLTMHALLRPELS